MIRENLNFYVCILFYFIILFLTVPKVLAIVNNEDRCASSSSYSFTVDALEFMSIVCAFYDMYMHKMYETGTNSFGPVLLWEHLNFGMWPRIMVFEVKGHWRTQMNYYASCLWLARSKYITSEPSPIYGQRVSSIPINFLLINVSWSSLMIVIFYLKPLGPKWSNPSLL